MDCEDRMRTRALRVHLGRTDVSIAIAIVEDYLGFFQSEDASLVATDELLTFGIDWIGGLIGQQIEYAFIVDLDERDEYLGGRFVVRWASCEKTGQDPRNDTALLVNH